MGLRESLEGINENLETEKKILEKPISLEGKKVEVKHKILDIPNLVLDATSDLQELGISVSTTITYLNVNGVNIEKANSGLVSSVEGKTQIVTKEIIDERTEGLNNNVKDTEKEVKSVQSEILNVVADVVDKKIELTQELSEGDYEKLKAEDKNKYTKLEGDEGILIVRIKDRGKYIIVSGKEGKKIINKENRAKKNLQVMDEYKSLLKTELKSKELKTNEYGYDELVNKGESEELIKKNSEIEKKYNELTEEEKKYVELRKNDEGLFQFIVIQETEEEAFLSMREKLIKQGLLPSGEHKIETSTVGEVSNASGNDGNINGDYSLELGKKDSTTKIEIETSSGKAANEINPDKIDLSNSQTNIAISNELKVGENLIVNTSGGKDVTKTVTYDPTTGRAIGEVSTTTDSMKTGGEYINGDDRVNAGIERVSTKEEGLDGKIHESTVITQDAYAVKQINIDETGTEVSFITDMTKTKTVDEVKGTPDVITKTKEVENTAIINQKVTNDVKVSGKIVKANDETKVDGEVTSKSNSTEIGTGISYEGTKKEYHRVKLDNGKYRIEERNVKTNTHFDASTNRKIEEDKLNGGKVVTKTVIATGGINTDYDTGMAVKDGGYYKASYKNEKAITTSDSLDESTVETAGVSGTVGYSQKDGMIDAHVTVTEGTIETDIDNKETTLTEGHLSFGEKTKVTVDVSKANISNTGSDGVEHKATEKNTEIGMHGDNIDLTHSKKVNEGDGVESTTVSSTDFTLKTGEEENGDGVTFNLKQDKTITGEIVTEDTSNINVDGKKVFGNTEKGISTTVEAKITSGKDGVTETKTGSKSLGILLSSKSNDLTQTLQLNGSTEYSDSSSLKTSISKKRVEYGTNYKLDNVTIGSNAMLHVKKSNSSVDGKSKTTTKDLSVYSTVTLDGGSTVGLAASVNEKKMKSQAAKSSEHTYKVTAYVEKSDGDTYRMTYEKNEGGEGGQRETLGIGYEGEVGKKGSGYYLTADASYQLRGNPGTVNNPITGEESDKSRFGAKIALKKTF